MDFVLHCMGLPFNGETIKSKSLGGSESAAYYLAREIARRGHRVKVFTSEPTDSVSEDVQYIWHGPVNERAPLGERFQHYAAHTPHDVLIIQRHPLAFHRDYASKVNVLQLHDLALYRSRAQMLGGMARTTMVTTVSEWHKAQVADVYGINPEIIRAVPNGVDGALYDRARSTPKLCDKAAMVADMSTRLARSRGKRNAGFAMLYQSRPERGLEHLVRPGGIMARLAESHPFVHLFVCGYDNTTQEMAGYYQQLAAWGNELPNVTHLGALTKSELAEVQTACDLMCYPTEFEEVSCITAMEAMHAHLPMVTSIVGALPETCKNSGTILLDLKDGACNEDAFVKSIQQLVDDLHDPTREGTSHYAKLIEQQRTAKTRMTWGRAASVLLENVADEMRRSTPQRLLRHFIEHGDIIAAEQVAAFVDRDDTIAQAACAELETMYAFSRGDAETIATHYAHWESEAIGKAGGEDRVIAAIDNCMGTTRFAGIRNYVGEAVEDGAARILEIGCAYGHITLGLARLFPHVQFVAVDFVEQNIRVAKRSAETLGVTNVDFRLADAKDDNSETLGKFDAVIMAEVLEHIRDYHDALEKARALLHLGGALILTTPTGRWEWNGTDNFKIGREHLHHFEREDIQDIFGMMPHATMFAPAGPDRAHGPLGSWVYRVIPMDREFGEINYQRKFAEAMPRETISLNMIVKNAEATLAKAVRSVIEYVDEVVIAVDPGTSDRTRAVIQTLSQDHPQKPFRILDGKVATVDGFDAARNVPLEASSGDWILWMDADEEAVGADNLFRVARRSAFNAYGVAQIHYSVLPAQVLTTDYPCRLFRNRRGVKFYGLVHEHPEDVPGKSIAHATMLDDVKFAHYGYVDEPTRRARFQRNLPLLLRDIEQHPDRTLNRFLMLRDIAQSIGFEREQGIVAQEQIDRAEYGCKLFHEIVAADNMRMIIDSLQFYSVCVEVLGVGFVGDVTVNTVKPNRPDTSFSVSAKARFRSGDDYLRIINRLAKESISNYESRYS